MCPGGGLDCDMRLAHGIVKGYLKAEHPSGLRRAVSSSQRGGACGHRREQHWLVNKLILSGLAEEGGVSCLWVICAKIAKGPR